MLEHETLPCFPVVVPSSGVFAHLVHCVCCLSGWLVEMIIGTLRSRVDGTSGLSIVGQVSLGHMGFFKGHSALEAWVSKRATLSLFNRRLAVWTSLALSMQLKANLFFQGWAVFAHVVRRMEEAVPQFSDNTSIVRRLLSAPSFPNPLCPQETFLMRSGPWYCSVLLPTFLLDDLLFQCRLSFLYGLTDVSDGGVQL